MALICIIFNLYLLFILRNFSRHLSFIDLERGEFAEILPEVMIFPEGLRPEGNIITEGNISANPPRGGSINDILYRKLKASKLRIKNLTRFSFESHIVWNSNDNIFQNLLQNFEKAPGFTFKI